MTTTSRWLAILLTLAAARQACGEPPPPPESPERERQLAAEHEEQVRLSRSFARAKFAASQADPQALAVAKREAAVAIYEADFQEYLGGRGSHYRIFPDAVRALQQELALAADAAAELMILERHWARLRFLDDVSEARFVSGRLDIRGYMAPRYYRLEVEQRLVDARERGKELGLSSGTATPCPDATFSDTKAQARAKFKLSQANSRDVAQERMQAVSDVAHLSSFYNFVLMNYLHPFIYWSVLQREAGLALVRNEAEERVTLEWYWIMTTIGEALTEKRVDAGRMPDIELLAARAERIQAEMRLIEDRPSSLVPDLRAAVRPGDRFDLESLDSRDGCPRPHHWRELARAKFAAREGDPRMLTQSLLFDARTEYGDRFANFCTGRMYRRHDASLRLLRAELATHQNATEREAPFDRYWTRERVAEQTIRLWFEAGRLSLSDLQEARFDRLEAELWLLQARHR